MSPSHNDSPLPAAPESAARHEPTLGTLLRQTRERRGLTQAELGRRLNLAASTIDALEREDLQALPGPVYVRGYLRRLAAELKIDEAELQQAHTRIAGEDTPIPRRPNPRTEPLHPPRQARRLPLLLGVGVVSIVLAGILAQRYLPESWPESGGASLAQDPPPVVAAPAMPLESIPLPPEPPLPPAVDHTPGDDAAASAPPHTLPEPTPSAEEPASPATIGDQPTTPAHTAPGSTPSPVASTESSSSRTLEVRIGRADSWVQVQDATGKVLLEERLKAGSTRRIEGRSPLQVKIGNAAVTSLVLDGQAVDLTPHIRPSGTAFIASLGG